MSLQTTIFDRLKKFFRVVMQIPTAMLTEQTKLGDKPLGFEDLFIDSDLRHRISRWFDDLASPLPGGQWDSTSTLGGIAKDIIDASSISDLGKYRKHAAEEADHALDREIGVGGTSVPVQDRPTVQTHLNASMKQMLIRDVAQKDLAGMRTDIVDAVVERMVS